MRPVLDPLSAVLGRIAEELDEIADRLSSVTAGSGGPSDPGAVTSWQEIDQAQQRARALATVVARLRTQGGDSLVNLDALTRGIGLDAVADRIQARALQPSSAGVVDLF